MTITLATFGNSTYIYYLQCIKDTLQFDYSDKLCVYITTVGRHVFGYACLHWKDKEEKLCINSLVGLV